MQKYTVSSDYIIYKLKVQWHLFIFRLQISQPQLSPKKDVTVDHHQQSLILNTTPASLNQSSVTRGGLLKSVITVTGPTLTPAPSLIRIISQAAALLAAATVTTLQKKSNILSLICQIVWRLRLGSGQTSFICLIKRTATLSFKLYILSFMELSAGKC